MKTLYLIIIFLVSLIVLISLKAEAPSLKTKLVMHEWGTFTSEIKYGSDGKLLLGLEKEEEKLPKFVYEMGLNSAFSKGFGVNVSNVTVKMETPVIYFYTEKEIPFEVNVFFNGGKISQWYPQKSDGDIINTSKIFNLDFNHLKEKGHIQWKGTILDKNSNESLTQLTTNHQTWLAPRKTNSNLIKVNHEVEKYLFYRGLGNFTTPFHVSFDDQRMTMNNQMDEDIPYVLIYQNDSLDSEPKILWEGPIKKKNSITYDFANQENRTSFTKTRFIKELTKSGLYEDEANAMLNTWDISYFKKEGLRIFWILPANLTENILPLTITPTPTESKRVLVGRINIVK